MSNYKGKLLNIFILDFSLTKAARHLYVYVTGLWIMDKIVVHTYPNCHRVRFASFFLRKRYK